MYSAFLVHICLDFDFKLYLHSNQARLFHSGLLVLLLVNLYWVNLISVKQQNITIYSIYISFS
jgi:hypothetical protein